MLRVNWRPSDRGLRVFGAVFFVGMGGVAFWQWRAGHGAAARALWGAAAIVGGTGLVRPRWIRPVYTAWTAAGFAIGTVLSRLALAFIFYGLLTPLALFFRWRRRDALELRRGGASQWRPHPSLQDPDSYHHLF